MSGRRHGLVCSIEEEGDIVTLVIEDVADEKGQGGWRSRTLYTRVELDRETFRSVDIAEHKLADIGLAIVARLATTLEAPDNETPEGEESKKP